MKYRFRASRAFWRSFSRLSVEQQQSTRKAFRIFKDDPFDVRLRTHKIHKLSARFGRTIYSAAIETDLRAVFYIDSDLIVTVDIGSHSVYRG
jgi:mRNA-degrading endonuclease YafQ of YafQ-DinJ toxin-antitoxin module